MLNIDEYFSKPINRKSVPSLTSGQVEDFLLCHGWKYKRTTGSHVHYESRDGDRRVSIPRHNNRCVSIGTLKSIIKESGIPGEKWRNFRY